MGIKDSEGRKQNQKQRTWELQGHKLFKSDERGARELKQTIEQEGGRQGSLDAVNIRQAPFRFLRPKLS